MSARADFLARIAHVALAERPEFFETEAIETGGSFDPMGAIKVIDLHGIRVSHDSTEGAIAAWVRAALLKDIDDELGWAELVLRDPKSLLCERRKAARIILAHSREATWRMQAEAELARIGGQAA